MAASTAYLACSASANDSASPIRRIAEGAEQQRDVVVLLRVLDLEHDRHLGEKFAAASGVEGEAIGAGLDCWGGERAQAAVVVGRAVADLLPLLAIAEFEADRDARGWAAGGGVED